MQVKISSVLWACLHWLKAPEVKVHTIKSCHQAYNKMLLRLQQGGLPISISLFWYFSHPWFLQYTRQRFSNCSGTYPAERYWGPSQYCNMNNFACTNLYFCYLPAKWLTESQNSTNPVRVEILPMWSPIPPLYPHLTSKMVSTILSVYISMTPSHCSSRE